ncbi:root hair defective 3 GTP-binding protein-domain-containing protein [Lactifluus subvellereus]|nr:root hair defective 3 GTP-binding protein-domain-containing protein [Lactifluus subvellereus]
MAAQPQPLQPNFSHLTQLLADVTMVVSRVPNMPAVMGVVDQLEEINQQLQELRQELRQGLTEQTHYMQLRNAVSSRNAEITYPPHIDLELNPQFPRLIEGLGSMTIPVCQELAQALGLAQLPAHTLVNVHRQQIKNLGAVFGSQSTGKSTLLNRLFGTNFDVMDESKRQQTTKVDLLFGFVGDPDSLMPDGHGAALVQCSLPTFDAGIWMCRGRDMDVLVMDVEGTDGRERGEDQSALFSLVSSEVLIVNLWDKSVCIKEPTWDFLRPCSNANQRTFLLLSSAIISEPRSSPTSKLPGLQRIWDTLSKPMELHDRKLTDYFDISFTALPRKVLSAERFESDVRTLRGRFTDKSRDDFVFKPAYHKRIPADGVAFYMEGIWEPVQTNKDLDFPTQQELLAQFRCDEISAGALTVQRPGQVAEAIDRSRQGHQRAWRDDAVDDVPQHGTIATRLGIVKESTGESAPISLEHPTPYTFYTRRTNGQGKVLRDVVWILLTPPTTLEKYDIPASVPDVLRHSAVRRISRDSVIRGQGPLQASFATEPHDFTTLPGTFMPHLRSGSWPSAGGHEAPTEQFRALDSLQRGFPQDDDHSTTADRAHNTLVARLFLTGLSTGG